MGNCMEKRRNREVVVYPRFCGSVLNSIKSPDYSCGTSLHPRMCNTKISPPNVTQQIQNTSEPEDSQNSSDILEEVVAKETNKTPTNKMTMMQCNQISDGIRPTSNTFLDQISSYAHVSPMCVPRAHVYYQPLAIPLAAPIYYSSVYNRPCCLRRFLCF